MTGAERPIRPALLLIGPTGSGKTPLGGLIEAHGLGGRRCVHFDFGARLRTAATSPVLRSGLNEEDRVVILSSLASGSLLEDGQTGIVLKVFDEFLLEKRARPGDIVVLNGMPRHAGQAALMAGIVRVASVVVLDCPAEVIQARIRRDAGGDRAGRPDDSPAEIREKIEIFRDRTLPLVRYYSERGAGILTVHVGVDTTADGLYAVLAERVPAFPA